MSKAYIVSDVKEILDGILRLPLYLQRLREAGFRVAISAKSSANTLEQQLYDVDISNLQSLISNPPNYD